MTTLVGGVIALVLGLLGLLYWWEQFVIILQAGIPLVLVLGGALAVYLGLEEWKDAQSVAESGGFNAMDAEAERYRAEAEKYKAELEAIKNQGTKETATATETATEAESES
ncbi:MAG: hypothetical protein V1816_12800 [Pseudomonadota bacterium]